MTDIRIGIIGTGQMAATMARAIALTPGVRILGVESNSGNAGRAHAFAQTCGGVRAFDTSAALLANNQIDLVYIASSTASHPTLTIAALDAGKAVLCEKPFATSLAEAQKITDAARRSGCFCMEALWTPFLPADVHVAELVRARAAGEPVHLSASFGYPVTSASHPALFEPNGGGVLLDRAIYPLSLALRLLGPVAAVDGRVKRDARGVDVHASIQLAHRSGAHSQLTVSLVSLLANSAIISGSQGSITLGAPLIGAEAVTVHHTEPPQTARADVNARSNAGMVADKLRALPALRRLKRMWPSGTRHHGPYGANPYQPLLQHMFAMLRAKQTESSEVPLAHSLEIMRIIEAVRRQGSPG